MDKIRKKTEALKDRKEENKQQRNLDLTNLFIAKSSE